MIHGYFNRPDHGYPLRLVVPGQIGGRSVKWINKIIVSENESQHHLHFWVSFLFLSLPPSFFFFLVVSFILELRQQDVNILKENQTNVVVGIEEVDLMILIVIKHTN